VETGPCHHGARQANVKEDLKSAHVHLVTPSGNYRGVLSYNLREIYFISDRDTGPNDSTEDCAAVTLVPRRRLRRRRWVVAAVCAVFFRRYRLRDSALEVFFRRGKHRSFFADFGHTDEDRTTRQGFTRLLMEIVPKSALKQWPGMSPSRILSGLNATAQWRNGEMSNFDYLMTLNTISGRSHSDLTQASDWTPELIHSSYSYIVRFTFFGIRLLPH